MCRTQVDTGTVHPNSEVDLPGNRIRYELYMELREMAAAQGRLPCEEPFRELYQRAERALTHIDMLLRYDYIQPFSALRTSLEQPSLQADERPLRIGVYPIAANPLHWAHVLIGLEAMARLRLDKVVYVIAGHDVRKPHLIRAGLRYAIVRDVLTLFEPYLCCSDIALGTHLDGETQLVRLLQLNAAQRMHAVYLAGADHYRRIYPDKGYPDTIGKLERFCAAGFFNTESGRHTVRAGFILRGHPITELQTHLPTCFLDGMPGGISSTLIRAALRGQGPSAALAFLPHRAYAALQASNPYRIPESGWRRRSMPKADSHQTALCL